MWWIFILASLCDQGRIQKKSGMEGVTLVLLAAGRGQRFGGLKQLQRFAPQDAALAEYAIVDAWAAGFRHFVAVVSPESQGDFHEIFKRFHLEHCAHCIVQETPTEGPRQKPWGTGHALYTACNAIHTPFIIINADDFYGATAYREAAQFLKNNTKDFALVGYRLRETLSAHGTVSRSLCSVKNGLVMQLQEYEKIHRDGEQILGTLRGEQRPLDGAQYVSMNFWVLQPSVLPSIATQWQAFFEKNKQQATAEFYLPMAIQAAAQQNKNDIYLIKNQEDRWFGITYAPDVQDAQNQIFLLTQEKKYPKRLKIL